MSQESSKLRVIVLGKTGVGKSTLINAVLGANVAQTGHGLPVTTEMRSYTAEGSPWELVDTRGFELHHGEGRVLIIRRHLSELRPDAAWLCIQEDGRRVEGIDVQVQQLMKTRSVPLIVVITKARANQDFDAEVQQLLPHAEAVIRVRAIPETMDEGVQLDALGIDTLLQQTQKIVENARIRQNSGGFFVKAAHMFKG